MKKEVYKIFFIAFSLTVLVLIMSALPSIGKLVLFNRAASNQINILIKLQGEYDKIKSATFKTKVSFYNQSGLVKEYQNQILTNDHQSIFKLSVDTTGLDLNQLYAVFIKPDKYLGKLFCSPTSFSTNCKTPQITILAGTNNLDLTQDIFFAGDIAPADGKIKADDISIIISQIGKVSTEYMASDINSDGMVQTVDYSLALYSLSKNYVDDPVSFTTGASLSPTQALNVSQTPAPTSANFSTPTPTTGLSNPTPTTILNTPTITPIPTSTSTGGTCKATINGKVYATALLMNFCSPLVNEIGHMCVSSQSDCTAANCIEQIIATSKYFINYCSSGAATLKESETRATLNCQVQFIPGTCIPTPTPSVNCNEEQSSC